MMFNESKYIQSSFSIIFERQPLIRRKANSFEDMLKGKYSPPQIIPMPDEIDPEMPRIIFGSLHGYSQIVISQVSLALNVTYSSDYQTDISKGRLYILERVQMLFDLFKHIEIKAPFFCGITTRANISSPDKDELILQHLAQDIIKSTTINNQYELQVRMSEIVENKFFNNLLIQNYKIWPPKEAQYGLTRLPKKDIIEKGIQVISDFNDRYIYNEDSSYFSSKEIASEIINKGILKIENVIKGIIK